MKQTRKPQRTVPLIQPRLFLTLKDGKLINPLRKAIPEKDRFLFCFLNQQLTAICLVYMKQHQITAGIKDS